MRVSMRRCVRVSYIKPLDCEIAACLTCVGIFIFRFAAVVVAAVFVFVEHGSFHGTFFFFRSLVLCAFALIMIRYESEKENVPMLRPSVKSIEWILRNGIWMQTNVRQVLFFLHCWCWCCCFGTAVRCCCCCVLILHTCSLAHSFARRPIGYPLA